MPVPPAATPPGPGGPWADYRRDALADDLVAAAVVTILLVPQSLAYALMAGLPPVVGVMASVLPIVAYALLGSSSTLAVGPVAVLAMMTAQAAGTAAQAHGVAAHAAALVLAAEMAAVFAGALLLRLDMLAALLSAPVLHGFIGGAAVAIALSQLAPLLGLAAPGQTLPQMLQGWWAAGAATPQPATLAVGAAALGLLWLARRHAAGLLARLGLAPRAAQLLARAAPMAVVLLAIAWMAAAPAAWTEGVALTGRVSLAEGLQFTPPWQVPVAVWLDLAGPAALLALVAYVESLAVAEALAARRGQKVLPRRELAGLAAANAAAAASGGMPVAGGFARSLVNFDAGARTRWAGAWTALGMALAVAVLGGWLALLPKAVLAATIVVAVLAMLDATPWRLAWRYARAEFALMAAVAAATVLAGVEPALLGGVLASVALLLRRTARPHWAEVGRLPGTEVFRNVKRFEVQTLPGALAARVDEALLFTNARWLADTIGVAPLQRPGLRHVVLMMSGVNDIDLTGLEALQHLVRDLRALGVTLHLSELKGPVADRLHAAGLDSWLSGHVFRSQHDADAWLRQDLGLPPP